MSKSLTPADFESRLVELLDRKGWDSVSLRQRYYTCRKGGCPHCLHGPYWMAKYRDGKHIRTLHLGKYLPKKYHKLLHKKDQQRKEQSQ